MSQDISSSPAPRQDQPTSPNMSDMHIDSSNENDDDQDTRTSLQWSTAGQPIGTHRPAFTTRIGKLARVHCSLAYKSWRQVPQENKDLIYHLLTNEFTVPRHRKKWILNNANDRWKNWKHDLVVSHIDTKPSDVERKREVPSGVKREDWEVFVDTCSTPEHRIRRAKDKNARVKMLNPHTTGRRGAARTAEELKMKNPDCAMDRTALYLATHTRKDGTAPTPTSNEHETEIRRITSDDPSATQKDLDHNPVAQDLGRDSRGRVRGMGGGVSKIEIHASGPYREQLESKDCYIRRFVKKLDTNQSTLQPSHTSSPRPDTGISSSSQVSQRQSPGPPIARTGICSLQNIRKRTIALGKVIGATPGLTFEKATVEVLLEDIMDDASPMLDGSDGTLGDHSIGEIIVWPLYYLTYLSSS